MANNHKYSPSEALLLASHQYQCITAFKWFIHFVLGEQNLRLKDWSFNQKLTSMIELYSSMPMFIGLIRLLICNISSLGMIIIMYSPEFALGKSQMPYSMSLVSIVFQEFDAYGTGNVKWRTGTGNEIFLLVSPLPQSITRTVCWSSAAEVTSTRSSIMQK